VDSITREHLPEHRAMSWYQLVTLFDFSISANMQKSGLFAQIWTI